MKILTTLLLVFSLSVCFGQDINLINGKQLSEVKRSDIHLHIAKDYQKNNPTDIQAKDLIDQAVITKPFMTYFRSKVQGYDNTVQNLKDIVKSKSRFVRTGTQNPNGQVLKPRKN